MNKEKFESALDYIAKYEGYPLASGNRAECRTEIREEYYKALARIAELEEKLNDC